jgi:hypothetical protein
VVKWIKYKILHWLIGAMWKNFVGYLEYEEISKFPFEIYWPLSLISTICIHRALQKLKWILNYYCSEFKSKFFTLFQSFNLVIWILMSWTWLSKLLKLRYVFWEGHKILQNLHRRFDRYYICMSSTNLRWRFLKHLWPSQATKYTQFRNDSK